MPVTLTVVSPARPGSIHSRRSQSRAAEWTGRAPRDSRPLSGSCGGSGHNALQRGGEDGVLLAGANCHRIAPGAPNPPVGRTITPSRKRASKSGLASSPTSAKTKFPTAGPAGSKPFARSARSIAGRWARLSARRRASSPRSSRLRQRGRLPGAGDVEGAAHLADRGHERGGPERVADAQAGEAVDLREGAQHDDAPASLEVLLDAVGVVRIVDVLVVGLVEHGDHVLGTRSK